MKSSLKNSHSHRVATCSLRRTRCVSIVDLVVVVVIGERVPLSKGIVEEASSG